MQRFYFEHLESSDQTITLKNMNLLNQLNKVIRAKSGDEFVFFNAQDNIDYIFELKDIEKREAFFVKVKEIEKNSLPKYVVNIVQAIPNKLEKIELLLQKWVETWVSNFLFFRSERSQKLNISENKLERLQKIVIEAVEQSGRNDIPEIVFLEDITLDDFAEQKNIIFHTHSLQSKKLTDLEVSINQSINVFVWPEWGFTDEEIQIFSDADFEKVWLGNMILRAETVGVVVSFYLNQM